MAQDRVDTADTALDEELLEFLEADVLEEVADPAFKAWLREQLLRRLREQVAHRKATPSVPAGRRERGSR